MKALRGWTRLAFLGFFYSHIFASLLIDMQAVAPRPWIPTTLSGVLDWYVAYFNDPLMSAPQELPWFQSLICLEMLFQVPFFFWATSIISSVGGQDYSDSFRCACIAYGAHTSTTMAPILASIVTSEINTMSEKGALLGIYLPYLVFPFWIMCLALSGGTNASKYKPN